MKQLGSKIQLSKGSKNILQPKMQIPTTKFKKGKVPKAIMKVLDTKTTISKF
jgi:hypothetical protein